RHPVERNAEAVAPPGLHHLSYTERAGQVTEAAAGREQDRVGAQLTGGGAGHDAVVAEVAHLLHLDALDDLAAAVGHGMRECVDERAGVDETLTLQPDGTAHPRAECRFELPGFLGGELLRLDGHA